MSWKKALLFSLVLILAGALFGGGYFYYLAVAPQGTDSRKEIVRISPGQSFKNTTAQLEEQGVIRKGWVFYFWGRITGQAIRVQAGHFQVDAAWSVEKILKHLSSGREVLYRLQIPEGLTWWEIGRILEERELVDFYEFRNLVHDQEFLAQHGIHATSAEGFLFPETYLLSPSRDLGAERLIGIMINQFWKSTGDLWNGMSFDQIYETVNLGSLIEKETGKAHERRKVSGVFHNRLDSNMLLQCDPTVIYGLGEGFEGRLRRSHLDDRENHYNTYRFRGFPPTPICSPGRASIQAALDPQDHNYYYFVSRNDGSHQFSKTLQEHNRAVYQYQIRVR